MTKNTDPQFQPGDLVLTTRYLPPIPSGSLVAVVSVHHVMNGGLRYSLAAPDSDRTVWAYPEDIQAPLLEKKESL